MRLTCEFDTSVPEDMEYLQRMFGAAKKAAPARKKEPVKAAPEPEPEPAKVEEPTPEPAVKAAPEPEPEPAKVEEPTPEPEVVEAEVVEEPSLEAAVSLASKLVGENKHEIVRAALNTVGSKRVSELKESDIPAFMEALSA